MNGTVAKIEGPEGVVYQVDAEQVRSQHAMLEAEWLVHPDTDCECRHQLLVGVMSLADSRDEPNADSHAARAGYSHMVSLLELNPPADGGRWQLHEIGRTDEIDVTEALTLPVRLRDANQAAALCRLLAVDLAYGALPAFPTDCHARMAWQYAIAAAVVHTCQVTATGP